MRGVVSDLGCGLSVSITDPNKNVLHNNQHFHEDKFSFSTAQPGEYTACVINTGTPNYEARFPSP